MDTPIKASRRALLFRHLPSSVLYISTTFRGLWSSPTPPTTRICFPSTATAAPARGVGIGGRLIHRSPCKDGKSSEFKHRRQRQVKEVSCQNFWIYFSDKKEWGLYYQVQIKSYKGDNGRQSKTSTATFVLRHSCPSCLYLFTSSLLVFMINHMKTESKKQNMLLKLYLYSFV